MVQTFTGGFYIAWAMSRPATFEIKQGNPGNLVNKETPPEAEGMGR